jgi:UPF0755 protein
MNFLRLHTKVVVSLLVGGVGLLALVLIAPPREIPEGVIIVVTSGASVPEIVEQLSREHLVRQPELLRSILRLRGSGGSVQSGAYRFDRPENLFTIAYRLESGDYNLPPARITFIEGMTVRDYAPDVAAAMPGITAEDFITSATQYEGYLFPDTYVFVPGADVATVITALRDNFERKMEPLLPQIARSGRSLSDVITLASLVEKEARTTENRRLVAGVLFNRLAKDMPLQVDAVFGYIFNRDTYSPSFKDLKVDSPYNTYLYRGLPPGPICNPGLDSIEAVLNPTPSKYLYYLTDRNGVMRYAITYQEHLANQKKYLR